MGDVLKVGQTPGGETLRLVDRTGRGVSVLDLVFDAVFERDFVGDTIYSWNPSAEKLYGWSRKEAVGRSSHALLKTVFPASLEQVKQVLVSTGRWEGELVHTTRDGSEIVVLSRWALYDEGGARRVLEVNSDITDRRRAEAERAQLAAIVESSSDAILGKTLDGVITSWNPAAQRLYQYSPEEIVGRHISTIVPPERMDELADIMQNLRRGKPILDHDTVRLRKDGERIAVSVSVSPIRSRAGAIVGAATIARDISTRKREEEERARLLQAEQEARTSAEWAERRLAFLAEASDVLAGSLDYEATLSNVARLAVPHVADWCSINVVDEAGRLRLLSIAHSDPAKVELAERAEERYPPDLADPGGMYGVLRTGSSVWIPHISDELLVQAARDEEHLALIRSLDITSVMMVPLRARDRVFGVISFISAESGRRYDEDDLALAEDLARRAGMAVDNARLYSDTQEALRIREEFLSIASHELKTPLTALQLQTQLLRRTSASHAEDTERTARILDGVDRQVKRLTRLTNDLLDVSRIAAGRFALELSLVDLSDVVREVAARFDDELAAAGSALALQAPPGVTGVCDRHRLDQVLSNLLSNAIKYGRGGEIEIRAEVDGPVARLIVSDRGVGIARADIGRIFDRFERVETPERSGGLGLGLFIVREIVEAHGGRVWVDSEAETGARFVVELPRTPEKSDESRN